VTFDDAASGPVPSPPAPLTPGTYQPTNYSATVNGTTPCTNEPDPDVFTAPAPPGPYTATALSVKGGATGAGYRIVDRSTRAGVVYTYRLQVVDVDGTRSWYGSARVRAGGT
jgi:hypothetical protein